MADEVKALLDEPKSITIGGETIELREMRYGQMLQALKLLGPTIGKFLELDDFSDFAPLLLDICEPATDLMVILSGQSRTWIDNLRPDEAVELAGELYQVNRDFFVERMLPTLEAVAKKFGLTGLNLNLKPTPSTPSSEDGSSSPAS